MKRNKNLQPLSRQHHNALMAVLLLKKGVQKNADSTIMKEFILSLWEEELKAHFIAEEKWLVPDADQKELHVYYEQMQKEHLQLRELIYQLESNNDTIVEQFYELLERHIRFEERIFFKILERNIKPIQLEKIGMHLKESQTKSCATFPIKFWE